MLQVSTSAQPITDTSKSQDPVIRRLRKMREKSRHRDKDSLYMWFDRLRATARSHRSDWYNNRMRWFFSERDGGNGVDFRKLRVNFEIERSLGRIEPELWEAPPDEGYRDDMLSDSKRTGPQVRYQIDPMIERYRPPESSPKPARIEMDHGIAASDNFAAAPSDKYADVPEVIWLEVQRDFEPTRVEPRSDEYIDRLNEIRKGDDPIEEMASQVVSEIRSICGCGKKHDPVNSAHNVNPTVEIFG